MAEKHERLLTPIGEARWAHVQEPKAAFDGKGEAKYQIDVVFDPADPEWKKWGGEIGARVKAVKGKNNPVKWDKIKGDDGTEKNTGKCVVTFKTGSKFKPALFDKFGRPMAEGVLVGNGSKVRVNYSPAPYEGFGGGIALYLNAVQVIDLVAYSARKAEDFGFDVSEPPPPEEPPPFPDGATPGGPSDAEGHPLADDAPPVTQDLERAEPEDDPPLPF